MNSPIESGTQRPVAVSDARERGVLVTAAAGNGRAGLEAPADLAGVLAVAGADRSGALCSTSAFGPGAILAPGCDIDTASGDRPLRSSTGGTSYASAFAASVLAALRTFRPAATADEVEAWLRAGRRGSDVVIDVAASFAAAGLSGIVDRARRRMPAPATPPHPQPGTAASPASPAPAPAGADRQTPPSTALLPLPRVRVEFRGTRLRLRVLNRPRGATVTVTAERVRGFSVTRLRRLARRTGVIDFRPPRRSSRLVVRFVAASPSRAVSAREYIRIGRR